MRCKSSLSFLLRLIFNLVPLSAEQRKWGRARGKENLKVTRLSILHVGEILPAGEPYRAASAI